MKNGLKSGMYVKVQVLVHENVTRLFPKSDYMYLVLYVYDIPIWWCLLDTILYKGWCCNERKASGGQYGHSALQLLLFIIRATFFPPDNLYFVVCCSCWVISLNFWWWLIHQLYPRNITIQQKISKLLFSLSFPSFW